MKFKKQAAAKSAAPLTFCEKENPNPTQGMGAREIACEVPHQHRGLYLKAVSGKSRAMAIKAKCLDCCCWQRKEVEMCTAKGCPLWVYRPYQKSSRKPTVSPAKTSATNESLREGNYND